MANKNVHFKLKMLDLVDLALEEMDKLNDREERTALVGWVSGFWTENIDALNAYAIMPDETRKDVKRGLTARAATARKLLGDK